MFADKLIASSNTKVNRIFGIFQLFSREFIVKQSLKFEDTRLFTFSPIPAIELLVTKVALDLDI